jgi:ParB family chromosome partitioning protein
MDSNVPSSRRGLGRGLGALIVNTESPNPESSRSASQHATPQADGGGIQMIAVDRIAPNPHQPRSSFDPAQLEELAASISEHGIIQPLITTKSETAGHYWLVAGERRWRAAQLAGLTEIPAIVREASSQQLMEWALVENVQRSDLNPLEEATAYRALMQEYSFTQAEVADRVGKSRSAVANTIRLLQLPLPIQQTVLDERISAGHARAMLALSDESMMERCLSRVIAQELSVRQTEELVKKMQAASSKVVGTRPEPLDDALVAHYKSLEDQFRTSLGTRVNLARNPDGSGRLVIHFFNDDDLRHLYERMIDE